jgi:hypothetical protein
MVRFASPGPFTAAPGRFMLGKLRISASPPAIGAPLTFLSAPDAMSKHGDDLLVEAAILATGQLHERPVQVRREP